MPKTWHAAVFSMFRKPREATASVASKTALRPSIGRPPTPPSTSELKAAQFPENTTYSMAATTPLQGKTKAPAKKTPTLGTGKGKGKPNGNIMSFFKKAESSGATLTKFKEEEDGLFLAESPVTCCANVPLQTPTPPREESSTETWHKDAEMNDADYISFRYNEVTTPSKRRRTGDAPRQSSPKEVTKAIPTNGPFIDDSDSDDERVKLPSLCTVESTTQEKDCQTSLGDTLPANEKQPSEKDLVDPAVPSLKRETTSIGEVNDFDGIEDFIDDEFPEEGEEYLERRWMEEQAEFEEGLEDEGQGIGDNRMDGESGNSRDAISMMPQDAGSSGCPICGGNTSGLNDQVREHPNVMISLTLKRNYLFM